MKITNLSQTLNTNSVRPNSASPNTFTRHITWAVNSVIGLSAILSAEQYRRAYFTDPLLGELKNKRIDAANTCSLIFLSACTVRLGISVYNSFSNRNSSQANANQQIASDSSTTAIQSTQSTIDQKNNPLHNPTSQENPKKEKDLNQDILPPESQEKKDNPERETNNNNETNDNPLTQENPEEKDSTNNQDQLPTEKNPKEVIIDNQETDPLSLPDITSQENSQEENAPNQHSLSQESQENAVENIIIDQNPLPTENKAEETITSNQETKNNSPSSTVLLPPTLQNDNTQTRITHHNKPTNNLQRPPKRSPIKEARKPHSPKRSPAKPKKGDSYVPTVKLANDLVNLCNKLSNEYIQLVENNSSNATYTHYKKTFKSYRKSLINETSDLLEKAQTESLITKAQTDEVSNYVRTKLLSLVDRILKEGGTDMLKNKLPDIETAFKEGIAQILKTISNSKENNDQILFTPRSNAKPLSQPLQDDHIKDEKLENPEQQAFNSGAQAQHPINAPNIIKELINPVLVANVQDEISEQLTTRKAQQEELVKDIIKLCTDKTVEFINKYKSIKPENFSINALKQRIMQDGKFLIKSIKDLLVIFKLDDEEPTALEKKIERSIHLHSLRKEITKLLEKKPSLITETTYHDIIHSQSRFAQSLWTDENMTVLIEEAPSSLFTLPIIENAVDKLRKEILEGIESQGDESTSSGEELTIKGNRATTTEQNDSSNILEVPITNIKNLNLIAASTLSDDDSMGEKDVVDQIPFTPSLRTHGTLIHSKSLTATQDGSTNRLPKRRNRNIAKKQYPTQSSPQKLQERNIPITRVKLVNEIGNIRNGLSNKIIQFAADHRSFSNPANFIKDTTDLLEQAQNRSLITKEQATKVSFYILTQLLPSVDHTLKAGGASMLKTDMLNIKAAFKEHIIKIFETNSVKNIINLLDNLSPEELQKQDTILKLVNEIVNICNKLPDNTIQFGNTTHFVKDTESYMQLFIDNALDLVKQAQEQSPITQKQVDEISNYIETYLLPLTYYTLKTSGTGALKSNLPLIEASFKEGIVQILKIKAQSKKHF